MTEEVMEPPRYAAIYLAMEAARIPASAPNVERAWKVLCESGNVTPDGNRLYCSKREFDAALSAIPIPAPTAPDVVERVARAAACAAMKADITKWFAALTDHTTKDDLTEQGEMS